VNVSVEHFAPYGLCVRRISLLLGFVKRESLQMIRQGEANKNLMVFELDLDDPHSYSHTRLRKLSRSEEAGVAFHKSFITG